LALHRLRTIFVVAVEAFFAGDLSRCRRRLIEGVLLPELLLRRSDQAKIVLGVLEMILGVHGVAAGLSITGKLEILLSDVMRSAADLHLGSVRLVNTSQRIVMMTTATPAAAAATTVMTLVIAVASAHALVVLSVSHDCLSLTPVSGDYCVADSFTQLQATLLKAHTSQARTSQTPHSLKRLGMTGQ
jgi:hypothetical protein